MGKEWNDVPERRQSLSLLPAGDRKEPRADVSGHGLLPEGPEGRFHRDFFCLTLEKLVRRERNKKHDFPLVF